MSSLSLTAETAQILPANATASRGSEAAPRRTVKQRRSWLAEFLFAPFEDIDERVRIRRR